MKKTILIILMFSSIGCVAMKQEHSPLVPVVLEDNITQAANVIHEDLLELTRLNNARTVKVPTSYNIPNTSPLAYEMSFAWSGSARSAINTLANIVGFKAEQTGNFKKDEPIIFLGDEKRSVFKILEDISLQTAERINMVINEKEKTIYLFVNE